MAASRKQRWNFAKHGAGMGGLDHCKRQRLCGKIGTMTTIRPFTYVLIYRFFFTDSSIVHNSFAVCYYIDLGFNNNHATKQLSDTVCPTCLFFWLVAIPPVQTKQMTTLNSGITWMEFHIVHSAQFCGVCYVCQLHPAALCSWAIRFNGSFGHRYWHDFDRSLRYRIWLRLGVILIKMYKDAWAF